MIAANATLFVNPAHCDLIIVELDGLAKQAEGAPQGRVYAHVEDTVNHGGLRYTVKLSPALPHGMGNLDEIAAQQQGCDVICCHLDIATMTASFDEDMNGGDTAYNFQNFCDEF